jgi:hypothetical protein
MVLMEASRAIDPDVSTQAPQAMLTILTFRNGHAFDLNDFISGADRSRSNPGKPVVVT